MNTDKAPQKGQPQADHSLSTLWPLILPTSFSWALSLVVWKFWPSSSTSLSKSERTSLNPELTGPMSSSRMDARNGCTFSTQLLSIGWATIAEAGNHQKSMSYCRIGLKALEPDQGWAVCPTEHLTAKGSSDGKTDRHSEPWASVHQPGKPIDALSNGRNRTSPLPQRSSASAVG